MSYDIEGKTILVTGANRGIGKAIVETFIKHGAKKVYAAVRNVGSATPLVEQVGPQVVPVALDLSKRETITEAAKVATDVDVVINNGGVMKAANPLDADAEEALAFEMEVNVYGLMRMARVFAPVLKANGGGAFVQLNSIVSMKGFPDYATYSASKAAAYSITQSLYWMLKEQGTQVVSVHPGPIATDMAHAAGFGEIAEPPEHVAEEIIATLKKGEFHSFTDTMARQIGGVYAGFAKDIVETDIMEG